MAVWQKLATILASDLLRLFSSQTMASDRFQAASFFRRPDNLTRTLRQAKVTTTAHERTSLQSSRFFRGYKLLRIPRVVPSQPGSILDTLSSIAMFSVTEVFILKNYEPFKIPTKIANCEVMPKCSHFSYFKVSFFTAALFQFIAVIFPPKKGHEGKDLLFKSLVSTVPHIKVGFSKSYMIYGLRGDTRYRCGQKGEKSGSMVDPMDS